MTTTTSTTSNKFRKQLLLPAEHGSWSWLLVPYFVGVAVGGGFNLATILVLIGGLALFLLRQPASIWVRIKQGKGRGSDLPIVQKLTIGLSMVVLLVLVGLLALELTEMLLFAIPVGALLLVYAFAKFSGRTSVRSLWVQLLGAIGLALMAPAAIMAATDGAQSLDVWVIYGLMAAFNVFGILYVRLRIMDTHKRPSSRSLVLWAHILVLTAVSVLAFLQIIPLLATLPFIGLFIRAIWVYNKPRPIPNIKKFGFTEVGVKIIEGVVIIIAYWGW